MSTTNIVRGHGLAKWMAKTNIEASQLCNLDNEGDILLVLNTHLGTLMLFIIWNIWSVLKGLIITRKGHSNYRLQNMCPYKGVSNRRVEMVSYYYA